MDHDQTFRYAMASGDDMIVHLDEAAARVVGLPGIIFHGLCTMAMVSHGLTNAVRDGDPTRLRRIAVRFSHALRPGERFTTRALGLGPLDGAASYRFESLDDDGQAII